MNMRVPSLLAGGICLNLLLGACSETQELATPVTSPIGTSMDGVPIALQPSDPGILEDPANYQPTEPPAAGPGTAAAPGAGGGGVTPAASSNAQQQVESFVRDFGNFIRDYELRAAMQAFNSEDVATLLDEDRYDVMFGTAEAVGSLAREFSEEEAERLLGPLLGAWQEAVQVAVVSETEASVQPNITQFFLGPVRQTETVTLRLEDNEWKIQLASPLTEAEAEAIVAHHAQLQDALYQIVDWLAANEDADRAPVEAAIAAARRGEPVELPGGGG